MILNSAEKGNTSPSRWRLKVNCRTERTQPKGCGYQARSVPIRLSPRSGGTRSGVSVAASFSLRVFDRGAVAWREKDRSLKAAATKSEAFLVLTQSVGTRKNRFRSGEAVLRIEKVFCPKAPELIQLGVEHVEDILSGRPLHQFVSDDRIAGQPVEPALR